MSLLGNLAGMAAGSMGGPQGGDMLGGLMSLLGNESGAAGNPQLMNMAMALLEQQGGVEGVLGNLEQGGMSDAVQSWVGTGANQSISPDQLQNALGGDQLGALAQQFGVSQGEATSGLAAILPQLIDKLSPEGSILDNALVQQGLSALAGKLLG